MSNPTNANPCCSTELTSQIPGPQGAAGADGAAGTNGVNAFSVVTAGGQVVPVIGSNVTLAVDDNEWMVVGQPVFLFAAGMFQVISLTGTTSVTLKYLDYSGNTAAGNAIGAGSQISPGGTQPDLTFPIPIVDGGTGADNKYDAIENLGVGQPASVVNVGGSQIVTATASLIAGCSVTVPATGLYLCFSSVFIEYVGATFATSRVVTTSLRDITSAITVATTDRATGEMTLAVTPSHDIVVPYKTVTLAAGDLIQLWISISVLPSAGNVIVNGASICLVPLRLT